MKKFKYIILVLILISCNKSQEKVSEKNLSKFDLKSDFKDFKSKMEEVDTLEIWFDHSVCTYQGYEKIQITKFSDSIKIKSRFKELSYSDNSEWMKVYERNIAISDTTWKIEKFLKRNKNRIKKDSADYPQLQLKYKDQKIEYFTDGLVDLNRFLEDYYLTMRKLFPENKNNIYGVDVVLQ
ncbi:hypothetical protein [Christiangramia forsetii]|uniref:Uncharacterized protein n=2 Tax=Christiangramia forsetii TaxID=411153 RepID=A0LZX9_CHRFK|nr:hypothetical protein [Christiangramia forsetii]GGG45597.1 hypothetical protein GCM10011532_31950 [Christiangramia forsetii]CAL65924.1 hypothetical protein GFO_0950 [Christiangramia forsetii KT0803]